MSSGSWPETNTSLLPFAMTTWLYVCGIVRIAGIDATASMTWCSYSCVQTVGLAKTWILSALSHCSVCNFTLGLDPDRMCGKGETFRG